MEKTRSEKFTFILTIIILFGCMTTMGISEGMHGVTFPMMKNDYGASNQTQGLFSAISTVCAVLSGIGCGFILKKIGVRRTLLWGCVLNIIPMIILPTSFSYISAAAIFLIQRSAFTVSESGINGLAADVGRSPGRILSLTHFFFGIGAMIGPILASFLMTNMGFGWKWVYFADVVLIGGLFAAIWLLDSHHPAAVENKVSEDTISVMDMIKSPIMIILGLTFSFVAQTEYVVNTWGIIYLQSSFGMDPGTAGASFLSLFFFFFALSRLVFGMFLDKIGYKKIIYFCMICTVVTLTIGFSLGENGIFFLAFSGFFVAIEWPALLALITQHYGKNAAVAMTISCALSNAVVVLMQLFNGAMAESLGGAWGYRMGLPYSILSIFCFVLLNICMKRKLESSSNPV